MPTRNTERREKPAQYEKVETITFSASEVIAALRAHYDLPKGADVRLTAETYDANPYMSGPTGPGSLAVRGTGAVAEIRKAV